MVVDEKLEKLFLIEKRIMFTHSVLAKKIDIAIVLMLILIVLSIYSLYFK